MFNRIKLLSSPKEVLGYLLHRFLPNHISDKLWIEMEYLYRTHEHLNLKDPITYTEKLQWLKLYDRNPLYTTLADKITAKEYACNKIGHSHIVKTLAIYETAKEIDISSLPQQFALKCNHDSHSTIICRDKSMLNIDHIRSFYEQRLKYKTASICGEWAYKNICPKIIAEELLKDDSDDVLTDYKWFCFDGEPQIMYISQDGKQHTSTDYFDMNFNHLPIYTENKPSVSPVSKPECFDEMKNLASILSKGIPHVRVDFYYINGNIYFGEMTFYHCGGMTLIKPHYWNIKMGEWINIDTIQNRSK